MNKSESKIIDHVIKLLQDSPSSAGTYLHTSLERSMINSGIESDKIKESLKVLPSISLNLSMASVKTAREWLKSLQEDNK